MVYIDHQLQAHSAIWGECVAQHCQTLSVPYHYHAVDVAKGNVEQQARLARYQALQHYLQPNDVLVLAHHQQDQAETLMLRLLSGAGVQGLGAMKMWEQRFNAQQQPYFLWRPLLEISRQQLQHWAEQMALDYVDDPMNHQSVYDRVWCRQQLWTVLEQRFPKMQHALARTSFLMQDAQQILDEVLQQDLQTCSTAQQLNISALQQLSLARQRQVLSKWIQGDAEYRPSLEIIQQFQQDIISAREDAQAKFYYQNVYYLRYQQHIYRFNEHDYQQISMIPPNESFIFSPKHTLSLATGQFKWQIQQGAGLDIEQLAGQLLSLKARQGGEKIRLYARHGSKSVKKWLQELQIEPWLRHQVQFLWLDDVLLGAFCPQKFYLAESAYVKLGGYLPIVSQKGNL